MGSVTLAQGLLFGILVLFCTLVLVWMVTLLSGMKRRRLGEAERRAGKERFQMIFENSPVSIWLEDFSAVGTFFTTLRDQGVRTIEEHLATHPEAVAQCANLVRVVDINRATLTLHGAESKEALLPNLAQTFTPEAFETFRSELVCLWNGDTEMTRDTVVQTLAGEPRNVTIYFAVGLGSERSFAQVLVSLIDITERKTAEAALQESERKFRDIFDNVLDGLYLLGVTDDGRFRNLEINPALEKSTGIPRSQVIGKTQEECVSEAVARIVNDKYRRCVEAGHPIEEEVALDLPAGQRFYQSTLIPLGQETGRITHLIGISRDITERKQGEDELRRLNRELRTLNEELELRVAHRTAELEAKNVELERLNKLFVGRELRMVELKEQISRLEGTKPS